MEVNICEGHNDHDLTWIFSVPCKETPVCMACLVEILEDKNMLAVKKKPALHEFSKLLLQSPDAVLLLKQNLQIGNHIVFILFELLKIEDTALVSQTLDVCVMLLTKLESEELIVSVLDHIQVQCNTESDFKVLLPFYLFVGRLIQGIPSVVTCLIQQYEVLVYHFCDGLNCPDEDVQSALVYVFVYFCDGGHGWEMSIKCRLQQQLIQHIICILGGAKSQPLVINTLGLLKKLVINDETTCLIMKLNVDGVTMMSVLKKLLVSKNDIYKKVSTQIMATVLNKQCSSQYLFDCIGPLCMLDQFYSKCHSVYGIESILRSLDILEDMKNLDLLEKGLTILSNILHKQPQHVPLFINAKMVGVCLSIIHRGIKQRQQHVLKAAMMAFIRLLRKDHLLLPVPFLELQNVLEELSEKVWQQSSDFMSLSMKKSKTKAIKPHPTELFYQIHFAASRLLSSCKSDPASCQSNYEVPGTGIQQQQNTLDQFLLYLINTCENTCIPIILNNIELHKLPAVIENFFGHLCELYDLDGPRMTEVIDRLVCSGFISVVLDIKAEIGDTKVEQCCNKFLLTTCHILQMKDGRSNDTPVTWPMETDFNDVKYRFVDLPGVLSQTSIKSEACNVYIYLLYHSFYNDDMVLSGRDLQAVLGYLLDSESSWIELSPLHKKCFIFLWAMSVCLLEPDLPKPQGPEYIIKYMSSEDISMWYTHHQAVLHWAFIDPSVPEHVHVDMVQKWITQSTDEIEVTYSCTSVEEHVIEPLLDLVVDKCFTKALVKSVPVSSEKVANITVNIVQTFLSQPLDEEDKSSFVLHLRDLTINTIQDIFGHLDHRPEDMSVCALFDILLMTYNNLAPKSTSAQDVKLVHCVIKWLPGYNTPSLEQRWLKILLLYVRNEEKALLNRVVSLVAQIKELSKKIENLLEDTSNPYLSTLAIDFVTELISCLAEDSASYQDNNSTIRISIQPLEHRLQSNDASQTLSYLALLTMLFHVKFSSPIVNLQHQGRFQYDSHCPLATKDFKVLYIYLQQFILQDISNVKNQACICMFEMMEYLEQTAPQLADMLLQSPWNGTMLEVLIQTTMIQSIHIQDGVLRIILMFLNRDHSSILYSRGDLMKSLIEFLGVIRTDVENINQNIFFRKIVQKVKDNVPEKERQSECHHKLFQTLNVP